MNYNITGYSTALFSTWYFIEELDLLFDAGDGVTSGLLQKSRKIDHVFISHADRDHLTGLLQLNQLNAREGLPVIYYPKDSGSFPAMEAFSKQFDPHVSGTVWKGIEDGDKVQLKEDIYVAALRNEHVLAAAGVAKSLSYKVYQTKTKLKREIAALPQEGIGTLMMGQDKANLSYEVHTNILSYSGDTPVGNYECWDGTGILIHEATFMDGSGEARVQQHGNRHSLLEEVLQMVAEIKVEQLILGHFSSRYASDQVDARIRALCKTYNIKIPIYRVLPGELHRNILAGEPVNG